MARKFYGMLSLLLSAATAWAQTVPSPKEHFGFNIGDDYQLATYTQTAAYFKKLAASDRTALVDIGMTEEGRHQYMLIVSAPENIKALNRYKDISQKLGHALGLTDETARQLSAEGKAVVWIDGGLHATETVGAHQLIETMYQLVTRTDAETMNILQNDIILLAHANPDGQELVSNWYMRTADPKKRALNIPRLYEKYVGHDNNRDFYMMNMKESQNISRQLFVEWIPQIMYNHHQRGPAGSVLAGPPYRDPFNHIYDPLIVTSIDAVGAAMNNRLNAENKPGYTQRNGSTFSTWWNGGLRTTPYFHNMVGLLTEIIGGPTPETVPLVPDRLIPNGATPNPIVPQEWHFRQSIDYSVSLNYAVLDYAARYRSELLFNIYRMGKNGIDRGSADHWTFYPRYVDSIRTAYKFDKKNDSTTEGETGGGEFSFGKEDTIATKYYAGVLKNPDYRDARAYIISADQPDFPTAVKFINALSRSGITIHKASAPFSVDGKQYPAGSYVVKTAQAFRPHVIDMFEPQDHPNDFQYVGGPPIRPYDAAGWTLAYQMGVQFDRILTAFDGPFAQLPYGQVESPLSTTLPVAKKGYLIDPAANNAFIAVNDLLKAGVKVSRTDKGVFYVPAGAKSESVLSKATTELGILVSAADAVPAKLKAATPLRIGIWNTYGGSIPAGWLSWLMEQYHYSYNFLYSQEVDKGDLRKKYDMLIFVTGAIPDTGKPKKSDYWFGKLPKPEELSDEFKPWLGRINKDTSIPQLKKFLEAGGKIVTIGTSTNLAYHLQLPVENALTEKNKKGELKPLPGTKYYIPGSLLIADLDTTAAENWGMPAKNDVYFDRSPVFRFTDGAAGAGMRKLIWFSTETPLHSGWAWGQQYLKGGIAAFSVPVGAGTLYAFGPEITFRGQSHGTFKLLFNQLYK
ncbi:M14 family metallopeptidase [Chitinophaga pinensis]|uniref:Peptidase M14, carboxypeptidase A n=1 Tax=Chitinophaga pinensis (strain ATCC 43595 / DSM 2588 / LMG 13176 / NBRC 15968 / NCIMB 11800 / UQM 2034) TaxID=485918 RepID=A0A979GBK9_CHIPD|nr:M14 metallopeptidase family protein [Chitinophaga pinensis]ACU64441.1 peptidase M14, carboxypeptidase A [Chitinophaga pinensis DSM 2588]